ncbi:hypothetical protein COLO4_20126 [Corchorus olitorius]|uniref:Integrase, catalytic core n=1 Tax=Corchorus olitorius TaxID=93759 RepID=A0A1R3J1I0_9ROSI|nr:hypothetical protein COLO4_20126 [Corchorus olitorius]
MDIQRIKLRLKEAPTHVLTVEEEPDGNPWYYDIIQYLKYQKYPERATDYDKRVIRRMSLGYFLDGEFKIIHNNSAPRCATLNGAVEAANKNIKNIIRKMTETYKDFHEKLPFALHAYRTYTRTSIGATPFYLVYGIEAVVPIEVEIPSLLVYHEVKLEESEWKQERYD